MHSSISTDLFALKKRNTLLPCLLESAARWEMVRRSGTLVWNQFGSKEDLHRHKMALIIAVEDANKSRKTEQAKIHDAIQLYKEILTIKTSQPKLLSEVESEDDTPADTSPVEKEEMDLLEKALERALRVRTGAEPSVTNTKTAKLPGNQSEHGATRAGSKHEVRDSEGHTKNKLLSKTFVKKELRTKQTAVNPRPCTKAADGFKSGQTKEPKIKGLIADSTVLPNGNVGSKKLQTFPGHGTLDHDQHTLPCGPKHQIMRSSQLSDKNIEAVLVSATNIIPSSKTKETTGYCLLQQKDISPEELYKWTNLKSKQNRLWDKILAFETKSSVSGRDQFMERMRATFPTKWPCGSPEKTQALFHRLTQQGHNLSENRPTKELMASQTKEKDTELEWKSWDRWRLEWGCLEWQKELIAPLPMTVTYTTERELLELEKLRMRVAQLQQETVLEKALSDTLSPHFFSVVHGHFSPSLLRDFYSLLGEGGERFPAIVLDSEPDS